MPCNIPLETFLQKPPTVSYVAVAARVTVTGMAIENLQPLAYVVASIAFAIGTCSIFLRLYCRWRLRIFGWDDFVAVGLLFINAAQQSILYIFLDLGCGIHINLLAPEQVSKIQMWLFVEEVYYMFVHWTIKQAFLLFYLRLSPRRGFQIAVYGTMALNTSFTIINWCLAFLQCRPMDALFHPENYPNAQCIPQSVVMMVPTALNAASDIVILALPIPTVLGLRMNPKRKAAVLGVIGFGSFSVITAICRFSLQVQMVTNPDMTYVLGRMIIAAAIEIEVAVVAVNLPALKSLFSKFVGGSSQDYSLEEEERKLEDYKGSSDRGLKGSTGLSSTRTDSTRDMLVGATLSGSEENLLRQGGRSPINMIPTTTVEIVATPNSHGITEQSMESSLPASQGKSETESVP